VQQLKESSGQYVTFYVGNEAYGVSIDYVQEIIWVPGIIKIPRTPSYLEGLANLRGNILTVIDTSIKFGLEKEPLSETSRVLVLNDGRKQVGFIVSRVSEVVNVAADEIEKVSEGEARADFLEGIARPAGGEQLLMVVDVPHLMQTEEKDAQVSDGAETFGRAWSKEKNIEKEEEAQLVSFHLGTEEYGLEIGVVQEIVHIPEAINRVPNSPDYLLGVMSLRNRVLPVLSLRRFFHLEHKELDDRARVVVINLGRQHQEKTTVGLVVDSVSDVLRIPKVAIEPIPALLRSAGGEEISRVCKLAEGKRLVYLLETEGFLALGGLLDDVDGMVDSNAEEEEEVSVGDKEEQLVVFKLDEEEFAAGIAQVREIIKVPNIVTVPKAPEFVEGIINLRGTIIPITDLRKRFGMAARPRDEYTRIVVVEIDGLLTGLIVDSVKEVLKISCSSIEAAPDYLTGTVDARFIKGIAKSDKGERLMIVLDLEEVLSFKEKETLIDFGRGVELETNTSAGG